MDDIMVTRSSMPTLDEYVEEIKTIWDSHWLTNMGPKHKQLEKELKNFLSVENIELFTNGHMALELALQAMNLSGEVITTPFTFASTTHAIVRNGLKPVFCDINPEDFTIDVEMLENLITNETCAIVPVHVYGNICDIEKIESIAKKYNLKVIYDAAHAFGVTYKGRGIMNYGDASMLSFHATKVFNTIEGGAICYKDKEFGNTLSKLKNFGIIDQENVEAVGSNAKMNEFCAAMGLCNLRHIETEINKRKTIVDKYNQLLSGIPGIRINKIQENVQSNYAYYPIIVNESEYGMSRDDLFLKLAESGIKARKYFYPITNSFKCYQDYYSVTDTPIALEFSKRVLTLPLYADLEIKNVKKICNLIKGKFV